MTDQKKRPEEDEVTEEQLDGVAGGATAAAAQQDISLTKQVDKASPPLMNSVADGNVADPVELHIVSTTDDEEG